MALVLSGSIDISGSMTATTIIVSAPGSSGIVSSSQQIQNYNLFAQTSSANTFYGNQTITGSVRITNGLIIGASGSFASLGSYPNALTVNGNTTGTFGGAIFLARGSATQWGIISNDSDDLSITNNNSFSTRNIKIYDSAEKIEFTYSGSLADNSAGYHNIAFTGNAIVPYQTNHYDLGSETNYFRDLYLSTGSIKFIDNGNVVGILSTTADGLNFDSNITIGTSSFEIGRRGTTYKNTNLVMGFDVMNDSIVTGQHNIGMGSEAGASLSSGNYNIMIGYQAGYQIGPGSRNVLIGQGSGNLLLLSSGISPDDNTLVGGNAGQFITKGNNNTALGTAALYGQIGAINTFQNNTAIGAGTATNVSGVSTNNIYIGAYAGPKSSFTTENYKFYVSNGQQYQQPYMFGNMATSSRSLDINASLNISGSLVVSGSIKVGNYGNIKDTFDHIHLYTSGANFNGGGNIQFGAIEGSAASGVDNYISFNGSPTTAASNTSVTIWGDNSGGGAALFLNRKSSQGVESWGYTPWTIGVDLGATSTPNGLYIGTGNTFLNRSIEFNYKGLTPNILFSGSGIIPAQANTYDLGTPTKPWREIYVSTGSINFVNNGVVVSTLGADTNGTQLTGSLSISGSIKVGSLVVSGSASFSKKLKIGPDIGAGINSSFENALEIGSNPDVGLGGAMFLGNTLGSSTWGMLSNGSNNFAIANQSGFQSRAITLYNTENKIEFLYSGSINAYGSGFHNIRFDENGIIPYSSNKYDLGSATNTWKNLYIASGSINFVNNGTVVSTISTNADGSQNFTNGINVTGSLRVTGSLKVGDWQHGEGVANTAKLDIRTASDRGLKINGGSSSDVIITAYRGASDDMIRSMRLEASDINIYTGDGNANTGSYIGGFNTNGLAFAAGKGIDFSATSNGSGTTSSELLNDYEVGTWTALLICGTSGTITLNSAAASCTYTKIGRLVNVSGYIDVQSVSSPTGRLRITGFPFTQISDGVPVGVGYLNNTNAYTGFAIMLGNQSDGAYIDRNANTGADAALDMSSAIKANSEIYFNLTYTTT